jgi:zinc/manganese transport system permease protein
VGIFASALGLAASFAFDLPTGATMVCTFGAALAVAGAVRPFLQGGARGAMQGAATAARWALALVLVASALQLMIAPRAEQPLLNALEYAMPALRSAYLNSTEAGVYDDARDYAERYTREADQLNVSETRSRAEGEALDDFAVQRISSFLKSYGEMRKGEEFVMNEVRGRARERVRWVLGAVLLIAGIAIAPGVVTRCFSFYRIHGM